MHISIISSFLDDKFLCLGSFYRVFDAICVDFSSNLFQLIVYLEYTLVEHGLVDIIQECARFHYPLGELKVRYRVPTQICLYIG
jgi:hypothetical protein